MSLIDRLYEAEPKPSVMVKLAPTIRLNSGYDMPIIGLGTYKGKGLAERVPADGEQKTTGEVGQAVRDAIDAGYRHIDCALVYENEEEVGDGIRAKIEKGFIKREDIFVTSKLWSTFHRPDLVEKGCRLSLKKLGLDYLDLYLIHWPIGLMEGDEYVPKDENGKVKFSTYDLVEVWKAMEDLVAKGLVKSIGVSNWNSVQLNRTVKNAKIIPAVNQIEVSPYLAQKKLVGLCQDLGIAVTAYCPLGRPGRLTLHSKEKSMLEDPTLIAIGKKYNKSSAQVILRYLIQQDIAPLPKSVTKQRIIDNFNVFDFQLTSEDIAQIDILNQNKRVVEMTDFKTHPEYPFDIE